MILSNLFVKHKTPQPRFAPSLFMLLIAAFVLLGQSKPIVGLVGIGTVVVITGILVELNRERIWDNYTKNYKKMKGLKGIWTQPNRVYYNLNVWFLWPFVTFLGLLCLWAAYELA